LREDRLTSWFLPTLSIFDFGFFFQSPEMQASTTLRSMIGKKIIKFQPTTTVTLKDRTLTMQTSTNQKQFELQEFISLQISNNQIRVKVNDPNQKTQKQMWGTTQKLIQNKIIGIEQGFTLPLRMVGVGYRALMEGGKLSLKIGVSHPVLFDIPKGVVCTIPAPQRIILQGDDWYKLTQFAANIRKTRPPEAYNQKGIFVGEETIKKKEGKKR
jgi:large subunit ribosomal protein L6